MGESPRVGWHRETPRRTCPTTYEEELMADPHIAIPATILGCVFSAIKETLESIKVVAQERFSGRIVEQIADAHQRHGSSML